MKRATYQTLLGLIGEREGRTPSRAEALSVFERLTEADQALLDRARTAAETAFQVTQAHIPPTRGRNAGPPPAASSGLVAAVARLWRQGTGGHMDAGLAVAALALMNPHDLALLDRYAATFAEALGVVERAASASAGPYQPPPEMALVTDLLNGLEVGEVHRARNLTIFGLRRSEPANPSVLLRDVAARGEAEVTEVSEGGSVPDIRIRNRSDKRVLILLGEMVKGARQDRSMNTDVLVEADSDLVVPVSCVEAGRWHYRNKSFLASGLFGHNLLRAAHSRYVNENVRRGRGHRSDQAAVWEEVERKGAVLGAHSRTQALGDIFEQSHVRLAEYEAIADRLEGIQGMVAAIGPRIVAVEVLETAQQFETIARSLVASLAYDALEDTTPGEPTPDDLRWAFAKIAEARGTVTQGVGLGVEIRLDGPGVSGSALTLDGHVIHLVAFCGGVDGFKGRDLSPAEPPDSPETRRRAG